MLTQEEKKAAIKQRHNDQCAIMAEITEIEESMSGRMVVEIRKDGQDHSDSFRKQLPYPELWERLEVTRKQFLTERLETLWIALESSQNTPIELPQ